MIFTVVVAAAMVAVSAFIAGAMCQQQRQHREPFTSEHAFRDEE